MLYFSFMQQFSTSIAGHPLVGTIVRRKIRGHVRYYHQWRENGKTFNRYLRDEAVEPLRQALAAARLSRHLPAATGTVPRGMAGTVPRDLAVDCPRANVLTGTVLGDLALTVRRLRKRRMVADIVDFLTGTEGAAFESGGDVLIVHGPPRSGKTTMLRQALLELPPAERDKAAYVSLHATLSPGDLFADLAFLHRSGFKYVLVDGIERAPETLDALPSLSDTFAAMGMKLVLAGAVPAGYGAREVHTGILSYRDYCLMAGDNGMTIPDAFLDASGAIRAQPSDSVLWFALQAICRSSLAVMMRDYQKNQSHRLGARLTHDLARILARLEEQGAENGTGSLADSEIDSLIALGLVARIEDEVFICQNALRRNLSAVLIEEVLDDPVCDHLGAAERKLVRDELLFEVRERTLADTILLETAHSVDPEQSRVFRVRFEAGGFDMVVANRDELFCELYSVFLTDERTPRQLQSLLDPRKLDAIEHRYGTIAAREVFYQGRNARHGTGISYRNAAEYLKGL